MSIQRYTALNGAFGEHESGGVVLYADYLNEINDLKDEIKEVINNFTLGFIGVDEAIDKISEIAERSSK